LQSPAACSDCTTAGSECPHNNVTVSCAFSLPQICRGLLNLQAILCKWATGPAGSWPSRSRCCPSPRLVVEICLDSDRHRMKLFAPIGGITMSCRAAAAHSRDSSSGSRSLLTGQPIDALAHGIVLMRLGWPPVALFALESGDLQHCTSAHQGLQHLIRLHCCCCCCCCCRLLSTTAAKFTRRPSGSTSLRHGASS